MPNKLNIVILMTDEQRHDHLSHFGHPLLKTPNIDALFREGVVFENAFCNSPLCVPSRINMMTGQYNMKHGGHGFDESLHYIKASQPTLVSELKAAGYQIGLAGKNHTFTQEAKDQWFDDWQEYSHHGKQAGNLTKKDILVREYLSKDPRPEFRGAFGGKSDAMLEGLIPGPMPFEEKECPSWRIAEDAGAFIKANEDNPFFLQVSFPDPHWPNVTPEPFYSAINPNEINDLEFWPTDFKDHPFKLFVQSQVNDFANYTEADRKRILATYYGQVMAIDRAIGEILDTLDQLNKRDDTIIVFTADHGNFGGRYGLIGKCGVFCDALLRIPFAIKIPGMAAHSSQATINMIDLAPTLLDACGLPPLAKAQGESFLPVLNNEQNHHRDCTFAEVGIPGNPPPNVPLEKFDDYRRKCQNEKGVSWFLDHSITGHAASVRESNWKYSFHPGDAEELYDLQNDPAEIKNLAKDIKYAEEKNRLQRKLFEWLLNQAST